MGLEYAKIWDEIPLLRAAFESGKELLKRGSALISDIAEVTNSVVAGASGLMSNISDKATSFSMGSSTRDEGQEQCQKLGGNAKKQELLAAMDAAPVDKNHADFRTVMAPIVPMEVAQSKGASMGNSFG